VPADATANEAELARDRVVLEVAADGLGRRIVGAADDARSIDERQRPARRIRARVARSSGCEPCIVQEFFPSGRGRLSKISSLETPSPTL